MSDEKLEYLLSKVDHPLYGRAGKAHAAEALRRYVAGEPLVRWHRWPLTGWSWVCPDPFCQIWRVEFETEQRCRKAWFEHATEHPDMKPSWPDTSGITLPANRVEENAQLDLLVELGYEPAEATPAAQRPRRVVTVGLLAEVS